MATLGWVGLGDVGLPMMARLAEAGHEVRAWGRSRARREAAQAAGATLVDSAAELGRSCEAVFLCVTDTDAVHEIVFGVDGIASASGGESLVVDHSTIHPGRTREMAARLRDAGRGRWIDAPVSGGAVGARAGTLAVMAGGVAADIATATPWIRAYGGKVTHVGANGAGQLCKSCNQAIANATIMAWAEVLAYAELFGLDPERLLEATEGGFADSAVRRSFVPRILSGEFPGHYASLIPKDLGIPCDMGRTLGAPMPVTGLVASLYHQLRELQERSGTEPVGLLELFRSNRNPEAGR
jgi:3-hydroxyisobutyrate dehydrogenase-like beta-hydroxyacid dehydrogenase